MASIVARGKAFSLVYRHNGKQIWEPFETRAEAKARKLEVEYEQSKGTFVPPNPETLEGFLTEYVKIYGETKWSHSTYSTNTGLIRNYINPIIGQWKMKDITARKMDAFFTSLKDQPAVPNRGDVSPGLVSDRNIHDINLLLSNAFDKAVAWEFIGKNPVTRNACPDRESKPREVWDPDTAKTALRECTNQTLLACMQLAISCSLRIGEITGLRWEFVSFGDVDNNFDDAVLQVDAQLQRISRKTYEALSRKEDQIKVIFPSLRENTKTMLVLKTLKTKSSERVVWIPPTTAAVLWQIKKYQDEMKSILGEEYQDYGLVIAHDNGRPIEGKIISDMLTQLCEDHELKPIEFHSLRHLSTTVKLLISKGDIKSVQGETGHAQARMVTDTYAHILDGNRRTMAKKFERSFYGEETEEKRPVAPIEQIIAQCLQNPDAVSLLKSIFAAQPA